jgi:hypothetical protein
VTCQFWQFFFQKLIRYLKKSNGSILRFLLPEDLDSIFILFLNCPIFTQIWSCRCTQERGKRVWQRQIFEKLVNKNAIMPKIVYPPWNFVPKAWPPPHIFIHFYSNLKWKFAFAFIGRPTDRLKSLKCEFLILGDIEISLMIQSRWPLKLNF